MKKTLLLAITTCLFAELSDTVHSSVSTYYETKSFSSSVQKDDGVVYGVGADIHYNNSAYKITYEHTSTNTKQPPLSEDLVVDKLFLKYQYELNHEIAFNMNYISIVDDNIAITDGGKIFALGISYNLSQSIATNFTQYYSDYDDFNANQSDLRVDFKVDLDDFDVKISSITKYITLDEENPNGFTKYAQKSYLTTGLKLHSHYGSYHFGAGAYFGDRVFAIMDDGFKVQHHAMEITETYALGFGKVFKPFVLRVQYIYQKADELPAQNRDVTVDIYRFVANYKF